MQFSQAMVVAFIAYGGLAAAQSSDSNLDLSKRDLETRDLSARDLQILLLRPNGAARPVVPGNSLFNSIPYFRPMASAPRRKQAATPSNFGVAPNVNSLAQSQLPKLWRSGFTITQSTTFKPVQRKMPSGMAVNVISLPNGRGKMVVKYGANGRPVGAFRISKSKSQYYKQLAKAQKSGLKKALAKQQAKKYKAKAKALKAKAKAAKAKAKAAKAKAKAKKHAEKELKKKFHKKLAQKKKEQAKKAASKAEKKEESKTDKTVTSTSTVTSTATATPTPTEKKDDEKKDEEKDRKHARSFVPREADAEPEAEAEAEAEPVADPDIWAESEVFTREAEAEAEAEPEAEAQPDDE